MTTFNFLASFNPLTTFGFGVGESNHPMNITPRRRKNTNNKTTKIRKTTLATKLFEERKVLEPDTYLLFLKPLNHPPIVCDVVLKGAVKFCYISIYY